MRRNLQLTFLVGTVVLLGLIATLACNSGSHSSLSNAPQSGENPGTIMGARLFIPS